MDRQLVTDFGGTGFLGRRIVRHLGDKGVPIRVASRHPERARERFGTDDPRIESIAAHVHDEGSVTEAIAGAWGVVNAVSLYVEHGKTTFDSVHVKAARQSDRLKQLEKTKAQISAEKPSGTQPPSLSLPKADLAELYRQKIDNLRECLTRDESTRVKAAAQLRALINKVEVHPQEKKGAARLKITGAMSAVIGLTGGCKKTAVQVVAEEGIEPPTHGL